MALLIDLLSTLCAESHEKYNFKVIIQFLELGEKFLSTDIAFSEDWLYCVDIFMLEVKVFPFRFLISISYSSLSHLFLVLK